MAKVNVPNIKNSQGMRGFEPLVEGDYVLECSDVHVGPPKNGAPADVWAFTFKVIEGPPQKNGKISKNLTYKEWVTILQGIHPNYKVEWDDPDSGMSQMSVDQLKSMCIAMGVAPKGNTIDTEAFKGQRAGVHIAVQEDRDKAGTYRNRSFNWHSM